MLAAGVAVARTGNEFVRYHGKMMIIDGKALWVLGFNFTGIDVVAKPQFRHRYWSSR